MNIIICGAGRVGFSISKQLSAQGHSITVIDQSSEFIQKINDTQDVKGIVGRATFPSVLEKAGAEEADMIIAVTQNDETNMVICQVAYSIFKINKKIARVRGQEFLGGKWGKLYGESNLPIDVIISPELEVAKSLQRKLDAPGALDSLPFANGKIKVLEIDINKKCPLVNTELSKLTQMFPNLQANVLGVIRGEKFVILKKKDKVLVFQPYGRTVHHENGMISDYSGRSFEAENAVSIVKKLSKKFGVIHMAEFGIDFQKHEVKDPVASPMGADLRHWCGIIANADYFLGCDSSGQHMVHALDKKCTVVIGSTFPINVSYPDDENIDILDMGLGARTYSPIRVTTDEYADRTNDGIMAMNDKVEAIIVESVTNGMTGKPRIGHKYKDKD